MIDPIDTAELLAAFGRASLRVVQLTSRLAALEQDNERLRFAAHHNEIRLQAVTDEKEHLLATLRDKIETVRMDKDETDFDLAAVEPITPIVPTIILPFQGKSNPPLVL